MNARMPASGIPTVPCGFAMNLGSPTLIWQSLSQVPPRSCSPALNVSAGPAFAACLASSAARSAACLTACCAWLSDAQGAVTNSSSEEAPELVVSSPSRVIRPLSWRYATSRSATPLTNTLPDACSSSPNIILPPVVARRGDR